MEYQITEKEAREIKPIFQFVGTCSVEAAALIVNEILMLHPIVTFDIVRKSVDSVESVCLNGPCIQLNLEQYEE